MNKRIYCMDGTRIPGTHDSHPRQRISVFFFQPFLTRVFAGLFFFSTNSRNVYVMKVGGRSASQPSIFVLFLLFSLLNKC